MKVNFSLSDNWIQTKIKEIGPCGNVLANYWVLTGHPRAHLKSPVLKTSSPSYIRVNALFFEASVLHCFKHWSQWAHVLHDFQETMSIMVSSDYEDSQVTVVVTCTFETRPNLLLYLGPWISRVHVQHDLNHCGESAWLKQGTPDSQLLPRQISPFSSYTSSTLHDTWSI